jgi:L-cysteine desulfidase
MPQLILNTERHQILELIKHEVTPAVGCTEPIAVALAVAKAAQLLDGIPEQLELFLSANVLKNAMGVGIPGTGMSGLPIAIAMGAIVAKPELGLEILKDLTAESIAMGKELVSTKFFQLNLKEDIDEKLYIQVIGHLNSHRAEVIISKDHTRFSFLQYDDEVLLKIDEAKLLREKASTLQLSFDKVYAFALETPLSDIEFIIKTVELNKAAAQESLKGTYGHSVAQTLANGMMGNTVFTRMLSVTAAACDARMAGALFPVMSNSGSGNQGIAATLPVSVFAEESGKSHEELIRALVLSHLMTIYMKQSLGRLSGLCGAVLAATGAACGITYLMGGSHIQIGYSVKNMIGNITGMICDGAKPSCALKVSNGVSTATLSALLAMDNKVVSDVEGIIDESVDKTILNLTKIGRDGMNETDRMVLDIMTSK